VNLTGRASAQRPAAVIHDDEIFAGAIRRAHKVLRALAVDSEQLPPGEMVGGSGRAKQRDECAEGQS
jgi:hypothetical protein